jgi:hypothetical protein
VTLLDLATVGVALRNVLRVRAIDLPMVTVSAQVKNLPALIDHALHLP